nr:polyphenol oxidase family protein [Flaviflexus huanghaiensis]
MPGSIAGFTAREPGGLYAGNVANHVGDRPANVRRWRERLEIETGSLAWMNQVHGTTIVPAQTDAVPTADGLTLRPGQGAAVMVADCVPLLISGETDDDRLGAVVHVGRAGLLGGIVDAAIDIFQVAGITDISAVIGPAICGACYEVGEDLAVEAEQLLPGSSCTTRWGTPGIDIPGTVARILTNRGVRVDTLDICTMEDERFFSHRREPGGTGRFAGFLVLDRDTPSRLPAGGDPLL